MRYNTGNPVEPDGSDSPFDLHDNSANFDIWANDRTKTSWPDRLGVERKTWHGMEQQVNDWLAAQGFEPVPLAYVDGSPLTVDRPTQLIERDDNLYSVRLPASFPVSLSGSWSTDEPLLVAQVDRSLREDLANGSPYLVDSGIVGYRGRNLREVLDDTVHCVDGSLLQGLINDFKVVRIPHHAVLTSPGITIPNDRVLIVDGKLQLAANSPDGTKLITSASATPSNISIYGDGELDGNKANQSGASTKHTLVFFQDGDEISYQVRRARGNYFPRAIAGSETTGMIYFKSCSNSEISNARGYDYGRECFWLEECSDCEMHNLTTFGGADSWSGFQCHGTRNRASNWLSYNAGASSGSFDTTYGEIHGWIGINNTFTNVINFGHTGKPASHSVATGLIAIGGSRGGTSNICNGIQVGGGTIGLQIVNAQAHNSVDSGIQISDSASDITVSNFRAFNCGLHGVRLSGSSSIHVLLNDIRVQGCAGYAIRADGGIVAEVTGGKCISNTLGFIGVDGTSIVTTSMLRNGSDALFVGQSLVGMVVGTPITINNTNIHTNSRILLQASNAAGASAQPFVQSIGTGQMQIGVAVNATAGAFARIQIM
ncbi:hypothetical protein [Pseudomonas putida]|uniref:Uncharacterized protein n=1 Tax=Pseudomonas putida TaxID=303 RepID=A0A1X0ZT46_PSEPU|nr:hypothetical protein [Pseudomonas putida]ORL62915.1 hypothetical protein B7H17_16300 [Pseudomonas putida]